MISDDEFLLHHTSVVTLEGDFSRSLSGIDVVDVFYVIVCFFYNRIVKITDSKSRLHLITRISLLRNILDVLSSHHLRNDFEVDGLTTSIVVITDDGDSSRTSIDVLIIFNGVLISGDDIRLVD